eukprot:1182611-Prorocentrum_minimum.AAC.3
MSHFRVPSWCISSQDRQNLYMLLERVMGGEFWWFMQGLSKPLPENKARFYVACVIQARAKPLTTLLINLHKSKQACTSGDASHTDAASMLAGCALSTPPDFFGFAASLLSTRAALGRDLESRSSAKARSCEAKEPPDPLRMLMWTGAGIHPLEGLHVPRPEAGEPADGHLRLSQGDRLRLC